MTTVLADGVPYILTVSDISEHRNTSNFKAKQPKKSFVLDCLALKMEAVRSPESSVPVYQSTWRNFPDDTNLHQLRCETLKSRSNLEALSHL